MQNRICKHLMPCDRCPACAQDEFDRHVADQLAALDTETPDRLSRDFADWLQSRDADRALWGDNWPAISPEVP